VARRDYDLNASYEIIGAFWPYGKPDQKFTGSLSSEKGRLLLKAAPIYKASAPSDAAHERFLSLNEVQELSRIESIVGYTSEGPCTLLSSLALDDGGIVDFRLDSELRASSTVPPRS
jgi:hypothetical protein